MRSALLPIMASAAVLLLAALWPRGGQPVMLALPPGTPAGPAFAAEGWRIQRVTQAGPVTLLFAAPDGAGSRVGALRDAAGTGLPIAARAAGACAAASRKET